MFTLSPKPTWLSQWPPWGGGSRCTEGLESVPTQDRAGATRRPSRLRHQTERRTEPHLEPTFRQAPTLLAVDTPRPRLDLLAFAFALALVAWPAIAFASERNGAATIMCAMCLAGLVAGRIVGVPGRVLLPVALGLVVVLWMIWIDPPAGPRKTSALAHATGGALAGWALVEALSHRMRNWLTVALVALSAVIVLTLVWELGEYAGDRLFDTSLMVNRGGSAEDILFGTIGGLVGITVAGVGAFWRRGG
jgi:hypothetical protein